MSPSRRRVSATARAALAAVLACSVALAPLSASAIIDRGLGGIFVVTPGMPEATPQLVTADGWYDATDPATPGSIVLANLETGDSFGLPADSQLIGFNDAWAVWSSAGGEVQFRAMANAAVGSLGLQYSGQDATIDGDRLVVAEPDFGQNGGAIVSYSLPTGASTSTAYAASDFGSGLCSDGDWAVWTEPVGNTDAPDSWNLLAWNMVTGETVKVAQEIVVGEGQVLAQGLQLSGTHLLWTAADGAHVFDFATRTDRVVASNPHEVALSGDWVVWTATPPRGTEGVDDVFALDVSGPAGSAAVVNETSSAAGEWGLVGSDGWTVFQTPDVLGNPGVITAVDLATRVSVQVSDPSDPSSEITGIDGQRVSWMTHSVDESGVESYDSFARVLGLPGPQLKDRYTSATSVCQIAWAPVPAADRFEYRVGGDGPIETTTATSIAVSGLTPDAAIPVWVWSVRGAVKSEPSETFAVIATTSSLTLSTKVTTVDLNADVTFRAGLTAGADDLTGSMVRLECSADGVGGWTEVVGGEGSVSSGTAELVASAARTLYYRAFFEGDEGHSDADSPVVKVAARAAVGAPHASSTVKKGRTTSVSGVVRPDLFVHPSNSVTVYAYHHEGRRWRLRAKVTAVTSFDATDSTSSYSARLGLSRTGSWRLQAVYRGTAVAAKASSGYRNIRVK